MTTTDGALALNALILLVGLPMMWRGWKVLGQVAATTTRLETVLIGMESDRGLVGRVEGVAARVHLLESVTTALVVHTGMSLPKIGG